MSLRIGGMGWVTPLGSGKSAVWQRLLDGDKPTAETISSELHPRTFQVFRVPAEATARAPLHPRLRRSSAISRFAVVAGLDALEDAGVNLDAGGRGAHRVDLCDLERRSDLHEALLSRGG